MKFNKNLVLAGVLLVLLILAYWAQGPMQTGSKKAARANNFLADINVAEIAKIKIARAGQEVTLEKELDSWKIGGTKDFYVADVLAANLNNALNTLVATDFELVSNNGDKKSEFQTDESGLKLSLVENGKEYSFVVGKTAGDFVSTYVSRDNDNKTYTARVNLNNIFNREEWRDDQIFSFAKEDVSSIRFQYPDREFRVEKIDNAWQDVSGDKVNAILDTLSDMRAAEIPEQSFANTGLEKNSLIVQVKGEAIDLTLMVGDQGQDTDYYYAKKGSSDNIYLITQEERDALNVSLSDLK